MRLPCTTFLADPDELARRRALEAFIFCTRCPLLTVFIIFTLMVQPTPFWLSLTALGGCLLHNLLRLLLIYNGTLRQLQQLGRTLFLFDLGILLVGLWPMLRRGNHPVPVVLLLLLLEAAHRLRMESRTFTLLGIAAITLTFVAYTLMIGYHHIPRSDLAIWFGSYLAVSSATIISRLPLLEPATSPVPTFTHRVPSPQPELKPQQLTLLRLLATGLSNREIAEQLNLDIETIRTHLKVLYRQLGVHERAAAVRRAQERGDLPLDGPFHLG